MFSAVLRAASRPARASVAAAARPVAARRALSVTAGLRSDHAAPSIFGPGGKTGEVPSDEEQATGLARLQLLGDLNDTPVFDYAPLDASRVGTLEDPIKVYSLDETRIVGCTGCPADSHDAVFLLVKKDKTRRCPECGSAYTLDFKGKEGEHPSQPVHHH